MRPDALAGLDPRAKLVAFLAVQALLFIPTARSPHLRLLAVAIPLLALLPFVKRSWKRWLHTLAMAAPLLALFAAGVFLQPSAPAARHSWLFLGKSAASFLALALFVLGNEPGRLLQAVRQSGLPQSTVVILSLGYRFASQWQLELDGVRRAWLARGMASLPRLSKARLMGRLLPGFFERLLESAVHVHDAMASRGFAGRFPTWQRLEFSKRDAAFLVITAAVAAAIVVLR